MNPYDPSPTSPCNLPSTPKSRLWSIVVFCTIAYTLNVLALWGIALFHEAHTGSELREPFQSIFAKFGAGGLLAVALVYAIVPGVGFAVLSAMLNRFAKSQKAWEAAWGILSTLLMVNFVIDGILGLPLFTTG